MILLSDSWLIVIGRKHNMSFILTHLWPGEKINHVIKLELINLLCWNRWVNWLLKFYGLNYRDNLHLELRTRFKSTAQLVGLKVGQQNTTIMDVSILTHQQVHCSSFPHHHQHHPLLLLPEGQVGPDDEGLWAVVRVDRGDHFAVRKVLHCSPTRFAKLTDLRAGCELQKSNLRARLCTCLDSCSTKITINIKHDKKSGEGKYKVETARVKLAFNF